MIKKAQIRFIILTMSILLVVFTVLFGSSCFILKRVTERNIISSLDETVERYKDNETDFSNTDKLIALISKGEDGRVFYDCWFDTNTFNKDVVDSIIKTTASRPYYSGKIDKIYYKIIPVEYSNKHFLLVATDATTTLTIYKTSVKNALFIILTVYSILLYIVYRVSFIVFKPVKDAFNKQKEFISNASHELKTPLTVISANADVLRQSSDNLWLNNIYSQTERMNVLISDMLTLAKIDEGKQKLPSLEFNLSEEIIESVLPFDAVAFEKGKTIETDIDDEVFLVGDSSSVKKIVSILLDNAVKHAEHGGIIKVSLKKDGKNPILTVFNTGSDINSEDSNKIFERFYRADNTRAGEGTGSGLGLSIAKSIADANKWKISAYSRPQVSMTITVKF